MSDPTSVPTLSVEARARPAMAKGAATGCAVGVALAVFAGAKGLIRHGWPRSVEEILGGVAVGLLLVGVFAAIGAAFVAWRFFRKSPRRVDVDAGALRVHRRDGGVEQVTWDDVAQADLADDDGVRWRFVHGARETVLRDDGFAKASWTEISAAIEAALARRGVEPTKGKGS